MTCTDDFFLLPAPLRIRLWSGLALWTLALAGGCSHAHERDARADAAGLDPLDAASATHDAAPSPASCLTGSLVPSGGFHANDVLVASASCGGDSCVVFRLEGDPRCVDGTESCATCASGPTACVSRSEAPRDPEGRSLRRVFCGCRCGPGREHAAGPYCHCGADALCMPDADAAGGLCVPRDLALATGVCETDDQCGGGSSCDASHHCT